MKKFLLALSEQARPLSPKLLLTCFISGYTLGIIIYKFYGNQVHQFLESILEKL
jgi:hypothetical protein